VTPGDWSRDYPFLATDVDLAQYGYVEQSGLVWIPGTNDRSSGTPPGSYIG
jgi:hypothetical protein